MNQPPKELWLIRHGETEWSLSGAHTGRTDLPLTSRGEEQAEKLGRYIRGREFSLVLTSPMKRARDTCRIAGYGDMAQIDERLREWDYGNHEGRTTSEIRTSDPDWSLWEQGVPGGETIQQVAERAKATIGRCISGGGNAALFAHGHILRILACCWLGLPPVAARLFALSAGAVSILGFERETRVLSMWNRSVDE